MYIKYAVHLYNIISSSVFFRLCHACTRSTGDAFHTTTASITTRKLLLFIAIDITYRCICMYACCMQQQQQQYLYYKIFFSHISLTQFKFISFKWAYDFLCELKDVLQTEYKWLNVKRAYFHAYKICHMQQKIYTAVLLLLIVTDGAISFLSAETKYT